MQSGFMTSQVEPSHVGGEMEFLPFVYSDAPRTPLASRYNGRSSIWTDTGRSALFIAATAILQGGGKPVAWVPAFSCVSISQALLQAGFSIEYYSTGACLGYEEGTLPEPLEGETLLFIHYFGHYNSRMAAAVRNYRVRGVRVIEDCVQYSLSSKLGEHSDFAITSYRKLLPVVDGAALFFNAPMDLSSMALKLDQPDEAFVSSRMIGKIMRGARAKPQSFLPLFEFSELRLNEKIVPRQISWLSTWMLERLDWDDVIAKRRNNWRSLLEMLEEAGLTDRIQPIFKVLGNDDIPLGLVVSVSAGVRDGLRIFLANENIYCPVHWLLEHLHEEDAFPFERDLASRVLTLPIDQRMSSDKIERFVKVLASFFNQASMAKFLER